jgi:hypothetical protein
VVALGTYIQRTIFVGIFRTAHGAFGKITHYIYHP